MVVRMPECRSMVERRDEDSDKDVMRVVEQLEVVAADVVVGKNGHDHDGSVGYDSVNIALQQLLLLRVADALVAAPPIQILTPNVSFRVEL